MTPATWSLDPDENRWRRLADLNVARHGHGAAAVGSDVFVFAGSPARVTGDGLRRVLAASSQSVRVAGSRQLTVLGALADERDEVCQLLPAQGEPVVRDIGPGA